jgi:hypothetical protein
MITKLKYLGASNSRMTNGGSYLVLSFLYIGGGASAFVVDDGGNVYETGLLNPASWTVDSVSALTLGQIYP